jgi:trk system potassium uptake protein TrkA
MKPPRVCVVGLGRFGAALALELVRRGCRVTAVDCRESAIEAMRDTGAHLLLGDVTDKATLASLHLEDFEAICVTTGRKLLPLLAVVSNLEEQARSKVHCRVLNELQRTLLERLGLRQEMEVEKLAADHFATEICNAALG